MDGGSSLNACVRVGGDRDGIALNGGSMAAGESWDERLMSPEKLGLARLDTDGDGYSILGPRNVKGRFSVGAEVMLVLGIDVCIELVKPTGRVPCISGSLPPKKSCPIAWCDLEWLCPIFIRSGSIKGESEDGRDRFE
jgi:hypothetical protein